jgi:hypothetical protein
MRFCASGCFHWYVSSGLLTMKKWRSKISCYCPFKMTEKAKQNKETNSLGPLRRSWSAAVRYRGDRNPPRYSTTAIEIRRGTVPRRLPFWNLAKICRGTVPRRSKSAVVQYRGDRNLPRYRTAADQIVPRWIRYRTLEHCYSLWMIFFIKKHLTVHFSC